MNDELTTCTEIPLYENRFVYTNRDIRAYLWVCNLGTTLLCGILALILWGIAIFTPTVWSIILVIVGVCVLIYPLYCNNTKRYKRNMGMDKMPAAFEIVTQFCADKIQTPYSTITYLYNQIYHVGITRRAYLIYFNNTPEQTVIIQVKRGAFTIGEEQTFFTFLHDKRITNRTAFTADKKRIPTWLFYLIVVGALVLAFWLLLRYGEWI